MNPLYKVGDRVTIKGTIGRFVTTVTEVATNEFIVSEVLPGKNYNLVPAQQGKVRSTIHNIEEHEISAIVKERDGK